MTGTIHRTTVQGTEYEFFADFIMRGTMARNVETGETKQISYHGYIGNDLTVRKRIASAFGHDSFRK